MYIGANNYTDYDPEYCDGHYCPRDCDGCPWADGRPENGTADGAE